MSYSPFFCSVAPDSIRSYHDIASAVISFCWLPFLSVCAGTWFHHLIMIRMMPCWPVFISGLHRFYWLLWIFIESWSTIFLALSSACILPFWWPFIFSFSSCHRIRFWFWWDHLWIILTWWPPSSPHLWLIFGSASLSIGLNLGSTNGVCYDTINFVLSDFLSYSFPKMNSIVRNNKISRKLIINRIVCIGCRKVEGLRILGLLLF